MALVTCPTASIGMTRTLDARAAARACPEPVIIGSQNLYPAGLTEYGYIVDDAGAAAALLADYWGPMWAESSRLAVHGAACP